jgi:hypothetical protein
MDPDSLCAIKSMAAIAPFASPFSLSIFSLQLDPGQTRRHSPANM